MDELVAGFDIAKIGRAPAHFDPAELTNLNAKLLHALPFEAVAARLAGAGIDGGAPFWDAVKPNLSRFAEVSDLWTLVRGPIAPVIENAIADRPGRRRFCRPNPGMKRHGAHGPARSAHRRGSKGDALYHPLRLALTGREHGPELKKLLPLIGHARAFARLQGETA